MASNDWMSIVDFSRSPKDGRLLHVQIAENIHLLVESSTNHRDVRVTDGQCVAKIVFSEDWRLNHILVDDKMVWNRYSDPGDH